MAIAEDAKKELEFERRVSAMNTLKAYLNVNGLKSVSDLDDVLDRYKRGLIKDDDINIKEIKSITSMFEDGSDKDLIDKRVLRFSKRLLKDN